MCDEEIIPHVQNGIFFSIVKLLTVTTTNCWPVVYIDSADSIESDENWWMLFSTFDHEPIILWSARCKLVTMFTYGIFVIWRDKMWNFSMQETIHDASISCVFIMIIRQEYWFCGYWIEHVITYRLRCLDFRVFRRAVGVYVESGLLKLLVMKTSGFTTTALEVHSTVMRFAWRHCECHNSQMISPLNPIWQIYVHVQVSSAWLWLVNVRGHIAINLYLIS